MQQIIEGRKPAFPFSVTMDEVVGLLPTDDSISRLTQSINITNVTKKSSYANEESASSNINAKTYVLIPLFSLATLLNLIVIVLVLKKWHCSQKSASFVLNLTISNVLLMLRVLPVLFIGHIGLPDNEFCYVTEFVTNTLMCSKSLTLLAISFDTYYAVMKPFQYNRTLYANNPQLIIAFIWAFATVTSIPCFFGRSSYDFEEGTLICTTKDVKLYHVYKVYTLLYCILCFILPFCVLCGVYCVVFNEARRNSERARRTSVPIDEDAKADDCNGERRRSSTSNFSTYMIKRISDSSTQVLFRPREEIKTAVASLLFILSFLVCWLPYGTVMLLKSSYIPYAGIAKHTETCVFLLALSSCIWDPLVYVFRKRSARKQLKELFCTKGYLFKKRENILRKIFLEDANIQQGKAARNTFPEQNKCLVPVYENANESVER